MPLVKMKTDQYTKEYFQDLEQAEAIEFPRNARILDLIQIYKKSGRLLDVGVGTGLFMDIAQKAGFEVYGLDVSSYAIGEVARRLKIDKQQRMVISELKKNTFKKDFFDVVNMRHSIEHIKDPAKTLKNVYQILKPGGVVAIATPNSFGPHATIFKELWPHWSEPFHIQFFSKKSLQKLILKSGFNVLKFKTEELTNYDIFRALFKKMGVPISFNRATILTKIVNNLLAEVGYGEGLLVIAQKPILKNL
jgi:2-polyprenyl-3-methyl-5-hydroxy-6-metoxy-1,4-benzoquinol methylase